MTIKGNNKNNDLVSILHKNLGWHKARVKFLAGLVTTMLKLQTVNYIKLSQGIESNAKASSNLRRIQRFFADFLFSEDTIAKLLYAMLPEQESNRLCLDRTNWKFGQTNINILMLSVAYKGVSFPIMWKMLPKRGNSNSTERTELLNRYIRLFGIDSINSFMADREFIGETWFDELIQHQVAFYIRIKENMWVEVPGKGRKKAFWLFNDLALNVPRYCYKPVSYRGRFLYLSGVKTIGKNNKLEFAIIATYSRNLDALNVYKDRWQIETMFKAFKSSGFNLEQTHLNDIVRISKLIAVVCIAFTWAYKIGIFVDQNIKAIEIKKHGRRAMSFFKYGLNFIAHALLNSNTNDYKKCVKLLSCT
jgi:hypothetical protein